MLVPKIQFNGKLVDAVSVDFETVSEPFETFELSDGTVMKMRVTPTQILRLDGEFDQAGNPIYVVTAPNTIRIVKSKLRGEPTIGTTAPTKPAPRDPSVG